MLDEITFQLFDELSGKESLSEDDSLKIIGYIETVTRFKYIDPGEKSNVLTLFDYIYGIDGTNDTVKCAIKSVKHSLLFTKKHWENAETLFPENYSVNYNNSVIDVADLKYTPLSQVEFDLNKPIRDSIEYKEKVIIKDDGSVSREYTYQIYEKNNGSLEGFPLFSVYGEKAVTNSDIQDRRK